MMGNLDIYEKVRKVPNEAQKPITGGRLSGMTDINPMWRIKQLTELFGPCGIGWKYIIIDKRLEKSSTDEIAAFLEIELYVKLDDVWSEAIPGTGGSMFASKEKGGLHTSDECFKMALTDALSVACKALGIGADVYWDRDRSKYDQPAELEKQPVKCPVCGNVQKDIKKNGKKTSAEEVITSCGGMCLKCYRERKDEQDGA